MIKETRSDYAKKEFIHVLDIQKIEKSTKSMSITSLTLKTSEVVRTLNQMLLMNKKKGPVPEKNKRS